MWPSFTRSFLSCGLAGVTRLPLLRGLLIFHLEGFLCSGISFGPSQQISEVSGILLFQGEQKIVLLKIALQGGHCNRLVQVSDLQCGGVKMVDVSLDGFSLFLLDVDEGLRISPEMSAADEMSNELVAHLVKGEDST